MSELLPLATLPETTQSPRVLVIEDDRHVRSLLCDLLALWGYETDTAADGHDGLRCLAERPYAAVVTDFKMPGISGLAVAERVRERTPRTRVVMVTAFAGDLGLDAGRLGLTVLRKPLDFDRLREAVADAVAGPAASR